MAKWIFTRPGSWDYPMLGFRATTGDVCEADLAPDAWWDATDSGATVTVPIVPTAGIQEDLDGAVLVYNATTNKDERKLPTAAGLLTEASADARYATVASGLPRGRRIILLGDSLTAYNGGTSTATPVQATSGYSSLGMWRWANIMLGQALDIIGNSGIGGQEASQVAARFATDVTAYAPDMVAILAGTNDEDTDPTWASLLAMYEDAREAGIFVIAFTIPPTTDGALATYRQSVNDSIREYVRTHAGIALVDLAATWQDTDQAGFVALASLLSDGTHPNTNGAQVAGYAIAEALTPILPPAIRPLPIDGAPNNTLTNARFAGSGTSIASGWSIAAGSATFAYVARGDGRPGQSLAVTVPVGGSVLITQNVNLGVLLRAGDDYDFTVTVDPYDLETPGGSTQRLYAYTQEYNGSTFARSGDAVYIDGGAQYGSARYPAARAVIRTNRATFQPAKTLVQVVIALYGGGTYLLTEPTLRNLTMIEDGLLAPEDAPHTNLIANGTFETDTTGWSTGASAAIVRTTAQHRYGAAALQITHAADINSDGRYQKVTVTPSTLLNYCLWVYAPSGHLGKLNFNWYVGGGSYISVTQIAYTGTGGWQKLIGTISASGVPGTAGQMLFAVARGDATGTPVVYVDQVDIWQA